MSTTYVFLLLVSAFAAVGVINAWRRARRREGLESLAAQLGLEFTALTLGVPEDRVGKRKSLLRSPAVQQPLLEAFGINDLTRVA